MSRRYPVLGSRGVWLSSRPDGWYLCNASGEQALGFKVLDASSAAVVADLLGVGSVRILSDAVEVSL